jgi:hypothetical protein
MNFRPPFIMNQSSEIASWVCRRDGCRGAGGSCFRPFLNRQYSVTASAALPCHFSSRRRSSIIAVKKYFGPLVVYTLFPIRR